MTLSFQDLLDDESMQSDFQKNVDSFVTLPKRKGTFGNFTVPESQNSEHQQFVPSLFLTFLRLFCSKMYLWAFFRCKYIVYKDKKKCVHTGQFQKAGSLNECSSSLTHFSKLMTPSSQKWKIIINKHKSRDIILICSFL